MGRYNGLVGHVVGRVMAHVSGSTEQRYTAREEIDHAGMRFVVDVCVTRRTDAPFRVDVGAYTSTHRTPGRNVVELLVDLDQSEPERHRYRELSAELREVVRHEVEHLTQAGYNRVPGKPRPTTSSPVRALRTPDDRARYFLLRDEVPAFVHGLHQKSRSKGTFLDHEMVEHLNAYGLTGQQKEFIMTQWVAYARSALPHARWSDWVWGWRDDDEK